ncbi:hypothetical protein JCM3765_005842 [Sporobolomyces pararoseus]
MDLGSKSSSRDSRDRDRDRDSDRNNSIQRANSSLPPSRNRLPPTAPSSSLYSPPLRVSSLPNASSSTSSLSSLPLPVLPPTGPAAYRSQQQSHSQHRSHSQPNSPLVSAGPPLRMGISSNPSSSNTSLPVRPSSVNSKRNLGGGGIRSRSPSVVSDRISTPSSSRLPPMTHNSIRSSGGIIKKEEDSITSTLTAEERKREELKRLERAERFGIAPVSTPTSSTSTTPAVGTSRSRLEGITNALSSPRSNPAPSKFYPLPPSTSSFSSKSFNTITAATNAGSTSTTSSSTGFQIPYKNRTSRSRKRSRQEEEEEETESLYQEKDRVRGYSSRNSSPGIREPRERERGVSRWDRGADRTPSASTSTAPGTIGASAKRLNGIVNGFTNSGSKSNYTSSLLRFPVDSELPNTASPSSSSRLSSNLDSRANNSQFVPIGNLNSIGNNSSVVSSKSTSRNGSNTSTPRARSPIDYQERERAVDRGWERTKDRDGNRVEKRDYREGSKLSQSVVRMRSRSRSFSPGEIPEPKSLHRRPHHDQHRHLANEGPFSPRLRSTRRSRSRSASRTRSRSPESRSYTPPLGSLGPKDRRRRRSPSPAEDKFRRRSKLEDEDEAYPVPTSDTPPLPRNRLPRSPRQPVQPSDTPPRPLNRSLPPTEPAFASTTTTPALLPSRRRLPPSAIADPPVPLASVIPPQLIAAPEKSTEPSFADEELEEGEEKEEGEIVSTSDSSSAIALVPFPSRNRIPPSFSSNLKPTLASVPPAPPPPPPPSALRQQSPTSMTPPRREPIVETRGETPPLPSPPRRPPVPAAGPQKSVMESDKEESEKDTEEGEIHAEIHSAPAKAVDTKDENMEKVEGGMSVGVVEEKREMEGMEMDSNVAAREVERKKAESENQEEESKDEEDVDMFEVSREEEDPSTPRAVVLTDDKNEQEPEETNKMQVDQTVPEQQKRVQLEQPLAQPVEEDEIAEPEMEVEQLEPLAKPSLQVAQRIPTPPPSAQEDSPVKVAEIIASPPLPLPQADSLERQQSTIVSISDPDDPAHPPSTTPIDHHSPPQPISPPTKHASPTKNEQPQEPKSNSLVTDHEFVRPPVSAADREEWFKPTWEDFSTHQSLMIPFLLEEFEDRDQRRGEKMVELRKQYRVLDQDWQAHVKRLDKIKERIQRKAVKNSSNSTAPQTPSIDSSGMPYYPEPITPGPLALGGGRTNRRGGGGALSNSTWGYGDAVRSEAEFLEILASLENADLRDPDVRAARTAAVVPDMAVDPSERAEIISCTFDDDRYRIEDPVEAYGVSTPMEPWTEAEVETFCKAYSQHPKQFGKIAQNLPDKTAAECVLFYYRMKNAIDFRSLSERRGRDGRRKKTKKRPGKGSSLLSNLKGAKSTMLGNRDDDDDDEEDDRPVPASPRNTRPPLPSSDSSSLLPHTSNTSATPRALQGALDRLFEDDNGDHTPSATSKNARNARNGTGLPQLHSEGMMEAAEVLGALAATPGDDQDDSGSSSLRPRAAKTNRKVRMDLDDDGAIETTVANEKLKPRRKANSSSYWSAAEKADIIRLLEQHGKNWKAIGEEMGTKTPVQCRNWFTNNAKKLGLRNLVNGNGAQDYDDQEDDSPAMTPLVQSPAVARPAPTGSSHLGYFPTPNATQLPPLPSIPAPSTTSVTSKAGMHLRNMLNDDTPDEEGAHSAKEDWFGGSNGGGPGDEPSEDESLSASAQSSRPVTANDRSQSLQNNRTILTNGLARPSPHLPGPAQLPSFPTSLPNRRFEHFLPHQAATIPISNRWSPAPASPFTSYGSPATPLPPSNGDHYRRPTPPDYFQAKTVYSQPTAQPHHHHRFSTTPGPLQPSPPIPSTSNFGPPLPGMPPPLPPPSSLYQNGWPSEPRR